ncbi:MAG: alpha/beta hydrolase domain-containing protein [Dehalococcoidia bacterium]
MALTRFDIRRRTPYADGASFGEAGPFERVDGVAHFAVDPSHEANAQIVDLRHAERGRNGLVHFEADFTVLQPATPGGGNGTLLFDVANRGGPTALVFLNNRIPPLEPVDDLPPANGFLFRHGFTVAWCGWQWDVPRVAGLFGLAAPQAVDADGQPFRGDVQVQVIRNTPAASVRLCDGTTGAVTFATYPAADVDEPGARLTIQEWPDGPRVEAPRTSWRFARVEGGEVIPDRESLWIEGGFAPGNVYDVFYTTDRCPVAGTGLIAVRDFVAALRDDPASPAAGRIERTLGFGVSQSGRFLRTFLSHGLNRDEAGRQVFDGVMPVVAGGRRGEFNHRFAQPSVEVTPGFGHLPPWADEPDGGRPGLLDRQRALGGLPKVVAVNSSSEYWRGDAWLVHASPDGPRDLDLPAETRVYLVAGGQHGPGIWPLLSKLPIPEGAHAAHWMNALDWRPAARAALVNLDQWLRGVEPPPSAVPTFREGTLVERSAVLDQLAIPGVTRPAAGKLRAIPTALDLGPGAAEGIGAWPGTAAGRLPAFVSSVDADGNELAGVRLPDITVPVATYTGWNPRHPLMGAEDQIIRYIGSTFPFAADESRRATASDVRPSLTERYPSRQEYEAQVRDSAARLVAARHLLAEEVEEVVKRALAKFDGVAAGIPTVPLG